ncbi:MAG: LamG domain-containing protein [Phycisphaeraceae bacterium]|nr:LamG domain-containing protein [Phycisphaeraceae bacterium]
MKTASRFAAAACLCAATSAFAAIDTGLVEYWDLDGDYDAAVDASHVGTLTTTGTGSGTFVAGKFGSAIDLESSSGNHAYIVVGGDESDFDFTGGDMSISLWYTTESLYTAWQALIAKGESSNWRLHRSDNDASQINFAGPGDFSGDGELEQQDGSWHHIVLTHEHNTASRMYVDGSLVATNNSATSIGNNNNAVMIGNNPQQTGRSWDGMLDDVALWDRALTLQEVEAIYNSGDGASIASLVPEPSSLALLGLGGLLVARRRRG